MKFVLISVSAIILAIAIPTTIVLLINKKHKIKGWIKAIIIPVSSIALTISFILVYFAFNYQPTERAKSYLKSDEIVNLDINQHWYHFDNKANDDTAIIFYSGAKVDPASYSPLCSEIAHNGVDVYLIKMPLYFPFLNIDGANNVTALNKHNNLYMMGHSLGGTTASLYLSKTDNPSYKGIIFLASYPSKKLNDSLRCLSIYGSNDQVLNKNEYNNNKPNFPTNYKEVIIEGGNHSNFGDYGFQRGDGEATITIEEQTNITKNAIINFIENS
jgi:hypothetical protein